MSFFSDLNDSNPRKFAMVFSWIFFGIAIFAAIAGGISVLHITLPCVIGCGVAVAFNTERWHSHFYEEE